MFIVRKFIIAAVLVFTGTTLAFAHLPVARPDRFSVAVGEKIEVKTGLAEPLIKYAYSVENLLKLGYAGGKAVMTGSVRYADGSVFPIAFSPARTPDPTFDEASVEIGKPGTAVVSFQFDFNSGTRPTVAYGKTLINWSADKSATERLNGGEALEVVQASDTGPVSSGQEIAVQLLLRGTPLSNASITATYDGAPLPPNPKAGEESDNEYLHETTDASGRATFTLDRPGIWVIGSEYVDAGAERNRPEYDKERYPEWKGIRYRATLVFEVKK
ncbi:MAG: DUF4198 domain-containing protein [Synergistaceae bacterium]|jgi:uncharacterized GH25 family protein|nr:DUF4198 domain-containing protein [Synergistaceae bacterium]